MTETKILKSDFDGACKDFLERHLAAFLAKFFLKIHGEINRACPFEFLDQELLRELMPEGSSTDRRVDKLLDGLPRLKEDFSLPAIAAKVII